ncbi:sigma-70 family RNA polymerase sigma factor [Pseudomonas sp. PDM16]|uniref:sigma-70 family RNA polymerase sigma factor n=1 Tax=Pseudomonas sp. PDM16 TaxID=2769292 RepID=UPI00177BB07A|nr:sigma-70 family RNA polymerase sigma factor [Pseudomonas sp. PDM16]MBD9414697.1 sigma-70 family RNA polymerase sigma factor [Pseudomonas sp. PDM16]
MAGRTSPSHRIVDQLYREHQPWLLRWFQRRLSDREQAADLSHDSFVRLLSKPDLSEEHGNRSFLALVARGLLIDHFRRSALERSYLEYLGHRPQADHPSPEQKLSNLQQLRVIDRQLDGLPSRVKQAFLLHRLQGLTQAQIAEKLGVSPASIQQYLARATLHCYEFRYGSWHD